jgi:hypothetical protein
VQQRRFIVEGDVQGGNESFWFLLDFCFQNTKFLFKGSARV